MCLTLGIATEVATTGGIRMPKAHHTRRYLTLLGVMTLLASALVGAPSTAGAGSVRGFDGSTIKIAGYGIKSQLPGTEWGARARVKEFNDSNELKGVKINFLEFDDDGSDPASRCRCTPPRDPDQVFALVPDVSLQTPGDFSRSRTCRTSVAGSPGRTASRCRTRRSGSSDSPGARSRPTGSSPATPQAEILKYVQQKTGKQKPTRRLRHPGRLGGSHRGHALPDAVRGEPWLGEDRRVGGERPDAAGPRRHAVRAEAPHHGQRQAAGLHPVRHRPGLPADAHPPPGRRVHRAVRAQPVHRRPRRWFKDSLVANPFTNLTATGNPSLDS